MALYTGQPVTDMHPALATGLSYTKLIAHIHLTQSAYRPRDECTCRNPPSNLPPVQVQVSHPSHYWSMASPAGASAGGTSDGCSDGWTSVSMGDVPCLLSFSRSRSLSLSFLCFLLLRSSSSSDLSCLRTQHAGEAQHQQPQRTNPASNCNNWFQG